MDYYYYYYRMCLSLLIMDYYYPDLSSTADFGVFYVSSPEGPLR